MLPGKEQLFFSSNRWLTILDEIVIEHDSSFVKAGKLKANDFIYTIVDSLINLVWGVCSQDNDHIIRR